jgi:hypothetical protein
MSMLTTSNNKMYVGAEPGVDPRPISAEATYGHMIHPCRIEVVDYFAIRNTHRVLSNDEFLDLIATGSPELPSKPKVRWITYLSHMPAMRVRFPGNGTYPSFRVLWFLSVFWVQKPVKTEMRDY